MKWLSTTLLTAAFVLLPAAAVIESQAYPTWHNRLALPEFKTEPNRHTPKHFAGTFLAPTIKTDTTLTAENNPILLTSTTQVQSGATLTFAPGTRLYANENASLLVSGQLVAKGFENKPIWFLSNEDHPLNQTWLGISVTSGGTANIEHTIIEDASPAISCLTESQTSISNSKITKTVMGAFIASHNCSVTDTVIRSLRDGIVVAGTNPVLLNNVITAKKDKIKKINTKY
jgi:hypothetical protein